MLKGSYGNMRLIPEWYRWMGLGYGIPRFFKLYSFHLELPNGARISKALNTLKSIRLPLALDVGRCEILFPIWLAKINVKF
jgi:hypothetical protein